MKHAALALALSVAFAASARADIPPPNSRQCRALKAGDACDLEGGGAGTCADETCHRASPTGDGAYACRLCEAAPTPAPAPTPTPAPTAPTAAPRTGGCGSCEGGAAGLGALAGLGVGLLFGIRTRARHKKAAR